MILKDTFFSHPTLTVAKDLLGAYLVREINGRRIEGVITEVEAYVGPEDKASHASRGRTPRTEVMFGPAGVWYVYMIYGMHHCLNIVTEKEGYPAAVLIRSITVSNKDNLDIIPSNVNIARRSSVTVNNQNLISGPGRVCRYFKIDRRLNNKQAVRASGLWIENKGLIIPPHHIKRTPRIGVEYAGLWKDKLRRFYLTEIS